MPSFSLIARKEAVRRRAPSERIKSAHGCPDLSADGLLPSSDMLMEMTWLLDGGLVADLDNGREHIATVRRVVVYQADVIAEMPGKMGTLG